MELAQKHGLPRLSSKVEIVNPFRHDHVEEFAEKLFELRHRKGVTRDGRAG